MRTIAVVNQKGGVGKTTVTANLGHALALRGHRVMLLDLDPQAHLPACLGVYDRHPQGADSLLAGERRIGDLAVEARPGLSIVPAGETLNGYCTHSPRAEDAILLRQSLERNPPSVDYLLIDCPPSASLLTANALQAADEALIPVAGDYLALTGLARLMLTIRRLQPLARQPLNTRIFLSRFIATRRLAQEVLNRVTQHFAEQLLCTSISEAAVVAESAGAGRTIFEYRNRSKSAREFSRLADDLLLGRITVNEQEAPGHVA